MKSAIVHSQDGKPDNDVFLAMIKRLRPGQPKREQLAQLFFKHKLGYSDARAREVFARKG